MATALVVLGCSGDETISPLLVDPSDQGVIPRGTLELPAVAWAQNPRNRIAPGLLHGYRVPGGAGGRLVFELHSAMCEDVRTKLYLFGPSDGGHRGGALTGAREEGCGAPAELAYTLPRDGEYLLVVAGDQGEGAYQLDARCAGEPCTLPGSMSWEAARIEEVEIAHSDAARLHEVGAFLFEHVFRVSEGLGNGLDGPAPNMRAVHDGAFGGPDAQSCIGCHHVGGPHGAGARADNILQAGDGEHAETALERNAPALHGVGLREAIAADISAQLQAQAEDLRQQAIQAGRQVHTDLCVASLDDPVCFGELAAEPDGTLDTRLLEGVDTDLVVRPFGWKGREATVRSFTLGGFRVHFGMQAEAPIALYCAEPQDIDAQARFITTWGDPLGCFAHDPDRDGSSREVTEGQLSAMAIYLELLEPPPPRIPDAEGEALFREVGCNACHRRGFPPPVAHDADLELPWPAEQLEVWTDFKRHDMGMGLADSKPFDNYPHPEIPPRFFMTPPLWNVASTAPYMHDGRAATLREAILAHGSEARDFIALSAAKQDKLLAFLRSLVSPAY